MAEQDGVKRALIVVDMQEDFCPPHGSLAVPLGRTLSPLINTLLGLPPSKFSLKIATKDWHPQSHISFASNHTNKYPFVDFATITNPYNPLEKYETRLWPDHCIQNTPGAEIIPELDKSQFTHVIEKGTDPRVEMYSAFHDPFTAPRVSDSGLGDLLKQHEIKEVYVVGLAGDYCVRCTAEDSVKEGFTTYVIEEGTKAVDPSAWEASKTEMEQNGVKVVSKGDEVVKRLFGEI
ncbi:Pyrazinamidase/nicotinamidase [Rhypophila decipiens]|uniref:nicotinamidase n=1 Tax=Rhypophila decipiens TaxID=261697 RepID=A0AAN6XZU5_9PEZI|nr:Pyrazinamidase/nicotinamidase [Rhypophila decipiens]